MTRVLALVDHSKIGCITQRRFAKVWTKTHPQRGAALDRNGLSVSTETACRFEPKSPVGNSEICSMSACTLDLYGRAVGIGHFPNLLWRRRNRRRAARPGWLRARHVTPFQ